MPIQFIRNDITKVNTDAVVNPANTKPLVGSGADRSIYRSAGKYQLLKLRYQIGEINPGQAVYTDGLMLSAKYIIHTAGVKWIDGNHDELDTLRSCYSNSLKLAQELKCESIAFPLLGTGAYHYPKDLALQTAIEEIRRFLNNSDMNVIIVLFDKESFLLGKEISDQINHFIDERHVRKISRYEYGKRLIKGPHQKDNSINQGMEIENKSSESNLSIDITQYGSTLEEIISHSDNSFSEKVLELITDRNLDDVEVYKKANLSRQVFSVIRSRKDYKPKKSTALALAISLKLSQSETEDLLARAGYAFSPSSISDLIVLYFIKHNKYDIDLINAALADHNESLLGSGYY